MSSLANNSQNDPRRPDKIKRFKSSYTLQFADDQLQEYMNVIGMIFSMCGLMMKVWCIVLYCIYDEPKTQKYHLFL